MKINWNEFIGKTLEVTMSENFGVVFDPKSNRPFYEIVYKTGKLVKVFDEGLLLEHERDQETVSIFIPHHSIKCIDIYNY